MDYPPFVRNRKEDVLKSEFGLLTHFFETGIKMCSGLGVNSNNELVEIGTKMAQEWACTIQKSCRERNEGVLESGCGLSTIP